MPIYEYHCPQCGHTFEEWVHLADAHGQEPCPNCGAPSPHIISHTSFVLKGGGWYVSDYGYRKGIKEEGSGQDTKDASASPAASGEGKGAAGGKEAKDVTPSSPAQGSGEGAGTASSPDKGTAVRAAPAATTQPASSGT